MSHDVISDALNNVMNAKKARKEQIVVKNYSKVLIKVLEMAKQNGYIKNFKESDKNLIIEFDENLHVAKSIKPRFNVSVDKIEFYMRRYLPAKDMGIMLISTSKGIMTHKEAYERKLGGSLIAYFY